MGKDHNHHTQNHNAVGHQATQNTVFNFDYTTKHPLFQNYLQKKGPQWSQIDDLRQQHINKFAGSYTLQAPVPKSIPGLIPRNGPLPVTRRWWRYTTSFERNGFFNLHTTTLNTRIGFPMIFGFLIYGWYGHAMIGRYIEKYEDNYQRHENFYDKLNTRVPPFSKIFLRPA